MAIQLLDCTLRDGAYIVNAEFGTSAIKGIISKLQQANVDLIECGWLKDKEHQEGTTFYHIPEDIEPYMLNKDSRITYVAMIDWDRYDVKNLPPYNGKSIDAVRVVFPHGKHREGIAVGQEILRKGYRLYLQAANTLSYTNEDLCDLAKVVNDSGAEGISVVDTFGAMYEEDLDRIISVLHKELKPDIKIGFHSHNNQQMAFANSMHFIKILKEMNRDIMVDSSLCGMGRGAGNATTELIANYLNNKQNAHYNMDSIMDAIDVYMEKFQQKFKWGYSTPYFIAGIYCCHVNNIAYLLKNHRTNSHDMRKIIESLSPADRLKYDYDLLENKYIENQSCHIDDNQAVSELIQSLSAKEKVLLIAPGKSSVDEFEHIQKFIKDDNVTVIAVNALLKEYTYDYLFLTNKPRYEYAKTIYSKKFTDTKKILLSNVKQIPDEDELIVNYLRAIKMGWPHFDNAVICALRLLNNLGIREVYLAGFDGFKSEYNESYADESLPTLNPEGKWEDLNREIKEMYHDVLADSENMKIRFLTQSIYE